jgi:putative transposase
MSSYRQLLYHLVFRTKDSPPTIKQDHSDQLYAYITGIIKNKSSHLYRINGVENHLHILTDLHPSIALADFMREIKTSSSLWMKSSGYFPAFNGWSEGYGSFTCSYMDMGIFITLLRSLQRFVRRYPRLHRGLLIFSSFRAAKDERIFKHGCATGYSF